MAISSSRETHREKVSALLRNRRFEDALSLLSRIETDRGLDPAELVAKGRAILLTSEETSYPLAAAEEAFQSAFALDPENVAALLELAEYYYAVEDDPRRALPLFRRAIEISRQQLTAAARGHAGCLAELDSPAAAAASLCSLHKAALLTDSLDEQEQAWLESKEV